MPTFGPRRTPGRQELISLTQPNHFPELFYWHREAKSSQAELDFVLAKEDQVLPIEVKSGVGRKMKSLGIFQEEKQKKRSGRTGIRISSVLAEALTNGVRSVPFYAIESVLE